MNKTIEDLQLNIKNNKLNRIDDDLMSLKQELLSSLKTVAKDKQVQVLDLTPIEYLDVVKSKYSKARKAAVVVISRSDKDVSKDVAYVTDDGKNITFDELTLEDMLFLNPINTNLNELVREMEYLMFLLPKQLTEKEMLDVISTNKLTSVRDVMPFFKSMYPNQYDNKLLASVAKKLV